MAWSSDVVPEVGVRQFSASGLQTNPTRTGFKIVLLHGQWIIVDARACGDLIMNPSTVVLRAGALALVSLLAGGCAMWESIDRSERGTAVGPTGGAVVSRPASAPTVRLAQLALNDRGYDAGNIDGSLGPDTASAVRRFQQAQGFPQTGALDAQTLSALGVDAATTRARRE